MKRPSSSDPSNRRGSITKRTWGIVLFAIASASIAIASACSNQGEGEICEAENNNDDCKTDEGLICFKKEQLVNSDSDRCCPADRSKAVTTVCKTVVDTGRADSAPPPDTGAPTTPDTGTSETDSGTEDANSGAGDADAADQ